MSGVCLIYGDQEQLCEDSRKKFNIAVLQVYQLLALLNRHVRSRLEHPRPHTHSSLLPPREFLVVIKEIVTADQVVLLAPKFPLLAGKLLRRQTMDLQVSYSKILL